MAVAVRVTGAADFAKMSKALKAAGRTELRKELHKGLRQGAKPLLPIAREAAVEVLPGDAGVAVAKGFRVKVGTGKDPGVSIVVSGKFLTAKLTNAEGRFRHPVHADPSKTRREWTWVDQWVPGSRGWFDRVMQANAPLVRPELLQAMERVAQKVVRGG